VHPIGFSEVRPSDITPQHGNAGVLGAYLHGNAGALGGYPHGNAGALGGLSTAQTQVPLCKGPSWRSLFLLIQNKKTREILRLRIGPQVPGPNYGCQLGSKCPMQPVPNRTNCISVVSVMTARCEPCVLRLVLCVVAKQGPNVLSYLPNRTNCILLISHPGLPWNTHRLIAVGAQSCIAQQPLHLAAGGGEAAVAATGAAAVVLVAVVQARPGLGMPQLWQPHHWDI
jgi:hypothetical protein